MMVLLHVLLMHLISGAAAVVPLGHLIEITSGTFKKTYQHDLGCAMPAT